MVGAGLGGRLKVAPTGTRGHQAEAEKEAEAGRAIIDRPYGESGSVCGGGARSGGWAGGHGGPPLRGEWKRLRG